MLEESSPDDVEKRHGSDIPRQIPVVATAGAIVFEPSTSYPRYWNTQLHSCASDEETSWWGAWCCWLLQSRTAHSFGVSTSRRQVTIFLGYITGIALSSLLLGDVLAILFAIIGAVVLAWDRATVRSAIRRKLNVTGSFCEDFTTHLCCSCCAVCQEAREEKILLVRGVDFCTGEDLLNQEIAYRRAVGQHDGVTEGTTNQVRELQRLIAR